MKRSKVYALLLLAGACTNSHKAFETLIIERYGSKDHGWQRPSGVVLVNPVPDDARSRAHGRELYMKYCSVCHGPEGRGDGAAAAGRNPPPADLRAKNLNRSDDHLYLQISLGRQGMPIWEGDIPDRERWDVVNYLKNLNASP